MERIVLEVDDTTGKIYRQFTDEDKTRFREAVSLMLKKSINDISLTAYKIQLDQWGQKAVENGLTQEKLDELLEADD